MVDSHHFRKKTEEWTLELKNLQLSNIEAAPHGRIKGLMEQWLIRQGVPLSPQRTLSYDLWAKGKWLPRTLTPDALIPVGEYGMMVYDFRFRGTAEGVFGPTFQKSLQNLKGMRDMLHQGGYPDVHMRMVCVADSVPTEHDWLVIPTTNVGYTAGIIWIPSGDFERFATSRGEVLPLNWRTAQLIDHAAIAQRKSLGAPVGDSTAMQLAFQRAGSLKS